MFYPFLTDTTTNKIVIKEDLFTAEECNKIIDFTNKKTKNEALISHEIKNTKIRKNKVAWLGNLGEEDNEILWAIDRIARFIYSANEEHYKFDLYGLTEPIQFTEYSEKNDHYHWHTDSAMSQNIRKLSISIQLSDPKDYKGSKLQFWETQKDKKFPKNQGTAVLFPSYMLHRVTPLLSGKRFALVTWVGGAQFK